ncbi:hypothetical protein AUJ83_02660 [Candidatus Woesearchaeota archaeon CG1_02_33_12]|nr:MAG: hypothetical protein AUJ83_02660 [Candidatus Woesearchaeota archaeon CG1_02_33_12]PIN79289.1 MAG: hypothetical protein COV14_00130 [Candidatus Woesearchaeota archaeon CG10_big_fil_rev_8_21_14_0_10_33_12]PIU72704.1 MAG: hypothetical protein COS79_01545 [Candidatus Woesearchaeota archaeon CG06_land_8_20_14_3_00_33_13]
MLESYCPKIIDKKTFIEYYSNVGIEKFINDMEKICKTFKGINISKDVSNVLKPGTLSMYAQGLIQEGVAYMLNLPIGKKAKSILTKAATDLVKIKGPKEGYKNAILILEDLVNSYRELFNEKYEKFIIISSLEEIYLN